MLWHRRSTPSPQSLSPRFYDEADVARSRVSPSFQTGSLPRQRPLAPASDRQFRQQKLVKVFQQPVSNSPIPSMQPLVQSNDSDALLSQGFVQQQYADGGQGSLSRGYTHPPQQSIVRNYEEKQVISNTHQMPANMMSRSYSATQSDPSSSSSQLSNRNTGGKHVRVLDASGRDVQVHAGFDGTDLQRERTSIQQSSVSSPSQPVSLATGTAQQTSAAGTNAYSDLEDIMASVSEFDVSYFFTYQILKKNKLHLDTGICLPCWSTEMVSVPTCIMLSGKIHCVPKKTYDHVFDDKLN